MRSLGELALNVTHRPSPGPGRFPMRPRAPRGVPARVRLATPKPFLRVVAIAWSLVNGLARGWAPALPYDQDCDAVRGDPALIGNNATSNATCGFRPVPRSC